MVAPNQAWTSDNIPEDQLQKIFEPFYRLEVSHSRQAGGTGFGLTIAQTLHYRLQLDQ